MKRLLIVVMYLALSLSAFAELQNVDVGGQLRVRARYWSNMFVDGDPVVRIPEFFLPGRVIGPFGAASELAWDDDGNDLMQFEQSTKLQFRADFTRNVSTQVDLFDRGTWGSDFRSGYVSGVDTRADSSNDIELLQSYLEVQELFGAPLCLRAGRQQIELGDGWLVGKSHSTDELAFDGIRLTYELERFVIDGWWTVLAEGGIQEQDGDIEFYGLNIGYAGVANHEFMAYWLLVRDGQSLNDTNAAAAIERVEDVVGLDNYDPTELHTVGVRISGEFGTADYRVETAYQTGNADSIGQLFAASLYGDTAARFDSWAGDAEIGFTFEVPWSPRTFAGGAYFGGDDHRDVSFSEWLRPFGRTEASVSFNRLFSSHKYGELFGQDRNASNFTQLRIGAGLQPAETVTLTASLMRYWVNDTFDHPRTIAAGEFRIPVAPALPFLTESAEKALGTIASLDLRYRYSDDLEFRLVAEHLFTGEGADRGSFVYANGLELNGGSDSDDATYLAIDTLVRF